MSLNHSLPCGSILKGGPQNRPQITIVLIRGIPQNGMFLGKPLVRKPQLHFLPKSFCVSKSCCLASHTCVFLLLFFGVGGRGGVELNTKGLFYPAHAERCLCFDACSSVSCCLCLSVPGSCSLSFKQKATQKPSGINAGPATR